MKRALAILMILLGLMPIMVACDGGDESSQKEDTPDANAAKLWDAAFADEKNGFNDANGVYTLKAYENGKLVENPAAIPGGDARILFSTKEKTRVAVLSEGYALTLPSAEVDADFSLGKLRSRYFAEDYVLTVTYEDQNPYGDNAKGFATYFDEWVVRYLENLDFLSANNIRRTRMIGVTEELLPGFTVNYYDMQINLGSKIKYDCYSIAIVRPTESYDHFWLFVLKSDQPRYETLDSVIASFKELEKRGETQNSFTSYELKIPENWNEETKKYFEKLQNSNTTEIGMFYAGNSPTYINWMNTQLDSKLDIFMTYYHIGWGNSKTELDVDLLKKYAGGDGFNGKPVLELTYQFTTTNNGLGGYTPMYDILRGKIDDHFRKIAKQVKEYGKPVLFRLNNEMNTDWTSYSGIQTMLDPDVFVETWRKMYDIFKEEGVDNCIWIFNPIAISCPYSNWGESLCYFPGEDYVQMLGLTYYQMNDEKNIVSFKDMYTELYKKNTPWFDNYPAIIGEFGCAAGGEVVYDWGKGQYVDVTDINMRRQRQADWITGMFDCLVHSQDEGYEFCKNIKAAAWFSANDVVDVNGTQKITNYLKLDEGVPLAIDAFKNGYKKLVDARK